MGDRYRALGQGEPARAAFQQALDIRERLARAEPERADYQRDLLVSLLRAIETDSARAAEYRARGQKILSDLEARGAEIEQMDELKEAFGLGG